MWINLGISVLAGFLVTIAVLLTRIMFYRIRDALPAGSLFHGIANVSDPCLIFILRMKDTGQSGEFITPVPNYSPSGIPNVVTFQKRQNTPWVTSVPEAQTLAHILNVLGRIGRTENLDVTFPDKEYDRWDAPMIILGGSWKATRAFETCNPYFRYQNGAFQLLPTNESFSPSSSEEDIGLLQKMINPTNGQPVWVIMGYRGAGTIAAAYALVRWWRYLGWLYGEKPFGLLVLMNDKDGWQQSRIISLYPRPSWFTKIMHFHAWNALKKGMCN